MIDNNSYNKVREQVLARLEEDRHLLDEIRKEIRPLRSQIRRIQPRNTTAISLVGTDGGNNYLKFDPFLVHLIRVVDSSNNEHCLEVVTPSSRITDLSKAQFNEDGTHLSSLGMMMDYLGVYDLRQLSHMLHSREDGSPVSLSWIQVYRELLEWAILFNIIWEKDFGTDTLIVFDGLLRSKVFAGDFFTRYLEGLEAGINDHFHRTKRRIYLAGVAKHSKVLTRYRLAMMLEGILTTDYPAYLEIPRKLEENAYQWSEYARGSDIEQTGGEINKFVGGKMFFVKFGSSKFDPIWPVDIFVPQISESQQILGYMLADAISGFPIPLYPMCLQKAHDNAALVDLDFDIFQDQIIDAIRQLLGDEAPNLDVFRLQDQDPSQLRYQ